MTQKDLNNQEMQSDSDSSHLSFQSSSSQKQSKLYQTPQNNINENKKQNDASTSEFILQDDQKKSQSKTEKNGSKKKIIELQQYKKEQDENSVLELKQILNALNDSSIEEITKKQFHKDKQILQTKQQKEKKSIQGKRLEGILKSRYNYHQSHSNLNIHVHQKPKYIYQNTKNYQQNLPLKISPFILNPPYKNYKNQISHIQPSFNTLPSILFQFKNILIEIKLSSYMNLQADIFIVPFLSQKFDNQIAKNVASKLNYNLTEIFYKETMRRYGGQFSQGNIFCVKSKQPLNNFNAIYFIKTPSKYSGIKFFDFESIKFGINNLLELIMMNQEQKVIIPNLEWGRLQHNQISQIIIFSIFKFINQCKRSSTYLNLRHFIISISNCEIFEIYSRTFHKIINSLKNKYNCF